MRSRATLADGRGSLLKKYNDQFGHASARRHSNVALRAARIDVELAYRARGTFLANMNHELRTPLNAIVGFTGMLKEASEFGITEETQKEYLDYILQSSELLLGHIDTLLELAAAESGGAKLKRQDVDVSELIDEVMSHMAPMAEAASVKLNLECAADLPLIYVDFEKISKAMNHLVENGIVYCEEGSVVTVRAKRGRVSDRNSGEWVYLAVDDNGAGMTAEELSRALKTFEQVHGGLDRKFEGAGIGLPIAKSFIELNNGKFNVKSTKGQGTSVRFALPAARDNKKEKEKEKEKENTSQSMPHSSSETAPSAPFLKASI